jgi:hypothetical protein
MSAELLTKGFPTSANFESNLSEIDMVGEVGDSRIIVNLPVISVPGCVGSSAKTLGHLQFLDMGGPPDGTRIVHHGTDELLM